MYTLWTARDAAPDWQHTGCDRYLLDLARIAAEEICLGHYDRARITNRTGKIVWKGRAAPPDGRGFGVIEDWSDVR